HPWQFCNEHPCSFLGYEFSLTSKLAIAWNHCHPWQFCNEHPCSFLGYEFRLTPKLAAAWNHEHSCPL
ncbi:hypothetical protein, partial [Treponema sp.]|uniref:hypothetical protein n=1 Tax=Treponema sp. TaxID=166 RepID=UPI003FA2FAA3